jgi:uncharacterized protein YjiS (DUF1127 family)
MSPRENGHQKLLDGRLLSDDDLADLGLDGSEVFAEMGEPFDHRLRVL